MVSVNGVGLRDRHTVRATRAAAPKAADGLLHFAADRAAGLLRGGRVFFVEDDYRALLSAVVCSKQHHFARVAVKVPTVEWYL